MNKLRDLLHDNYLAAKVEEDDEYFDKKDMEDCAIDVEYEIFSSHSNITMYRNSAAKLVTFLLFKIDSDDYI